MAHREEVEGKVRGAGVAGDKRIEGEVRHPKLGKEMRAPSVRLPNLNPMV